MNKKILFVLPLIILSSCGGKKHRKPDTPEKGDGVMQEEFLAAFEKADILANPYSDCEVFITTGDDSDETKAIKEEYQYDSSIESWNYSGTDTPKASMTINTTLKLFVENIDNYDTSGYMKIDFFIEPFSVTFHGEQKKESYYQEIFWNEYGLVSFFYDLQIVDDEMTYETYDFKYNEQK